MPAFISKQTILFQHCDPARIVFYPRYFEILNAVVEEWFDKGLGIPFAKLHIDREEGIPTVKIDARFMAPSRLGEVVDFSLQVARIGNSSADILVVGECDGEKRLEILMTVVHISNLESKSKPWPEDMRVPMTRFLTP